MTRRIAKLALVLTVLLPASRDARAQRPDVYARPKRVERSREFDALHYRIHLKLDDARKRVDATNTVTLRPFRDGFTRCALDAEQLRVTGVSSPGGQSLRFEQDEHRVVVHLEKPYDHDDTVEFTVAYVLENPGVDAVKYGMSRNYRLGLTFADATDDNPAMASTQSFPEGARHWFPCYDHPNDKATMEILLTVRRDWSALSNGRLLKVTDEPEEKTRTFHWHQDKPHSTYLAVVVAGPMHVIRDSLGDLPIEYWVYPQHAPHARRSFEKTPEIIRFFIDTYGVAYPWAKYAQATVPGAGGGAESTSATILSQNTIHDARADKDFSSVGLVAHEAAHQWWGDLVTMRDWSHAWLNEGFGTYGEYLFSHHDRGADEGAINLLAKKNSYLREARNRYLRPIVHDRWKWPNENFDRHTYPKAAGVLHMLRDILGDGPFFRTHKHFLTKHAYQSVDTHDFMVAVKEATGQNLDWFFDQWIFKPGHPVFDVGYTWDADAKKLRLRIEQTQDTSGRVPVFRVPVTIGVTTSAGRTSETIWLREKVETLALDCAQPPLMVRFDEKNVLLKEWTFSKSSAELLYQIEHADVVGRMWAAAELGKRRDDDKAVAALIRSARADPFWAVRREALQALSGRTTDEVVALLRDKAADEHSRVRALALRGLGALERPALADFLAERFRQEDSYVAQVEAIRALAKCKAKSALPLLREATKMKSHRDMIRRAAERAIKQLEQQGLRG